MAEARGGIRIHEPNEEPNQLLHATCEDARAADSLATLGAEVVNLLCAGSFNDVSERYGYAIANGREKAAAIQSDLVSILSELDASALIHLGSRPEATVKYFEANDPGLFATVEYLVPTNNGRTVLVELVIASSESGKHLSLEQTCAAT
jgi:hypothetical protein